MAPMSKHTRMHKPAPRIVLTEDDFDALVRGHEVFVAGARIILADIGLDQMANIIQAAALRAALRRQTEDRS
jgi:hypothetical protein